MIHSAHTLRSHHPTHPFVAGVTLRSRLGAQQGVLPAGSHPPAGEIPESVGRSRPSDLGEVGGAEQSQIKLYKLTLKTLLLQ